MRLPDEALQGAGTNARREWTGAGCSRVGAAWPMLLRIRLLLEEGIHPVEYVLRDPGRCRGFA
jgi:hypothetical protein